MADYSGLFPKTKGRKPGGEPGGLASIFDDDSPLSSWRPSAEQPRDYTQGGVWNRAYIDSHGALPDQLRTPWANFINKGFYRRRTADGTYEYADAPSRGYAPAGWSRDDEGFGFFGGPDAIAGDGTRRVSDPANWKYYAHDPAVAGFLQRYAPDPSRTGVVPPLNIPEVVERLANQQASRLSGAGGIYRDALRTSATNLKTRLLFDDGARDGERAAIALDKNLRALARSLGNPLTAADLERDPSYRLRQSEARRAVDAAFAGAGLGQSGARGRALQRTASEIASSEYAAADARRRADIQTQAGLRQSGFDRLIAQLNRRSDEFQEREREFTKAEQYGLGAEYQSVLQAISQLGLGQGAALDRIIEERDAEADRRGDEYLRSIQNEQRRQAIAEARAAAKRASRGKLYSDILGMVGQAGGTFLGGPAFAGILERAARRGGEGAGT